MPEMKLQLPPTIAAHIDQFTGRTWLLPTLLHWYEQTNERLFLLTGDPGTGKSMIMAWLAGVGLMPVKAEAQSQVAHLRAQVKAVHFCVAASGTTDPKDMAHQMTEQLTRNVPGFGKALATTLGNQVQIAPEQHVGHVESGGSVTGVYIANLNLGGLSEELSFNRILRDPLKQLYADGYAQPMLLLVDALDEAMTYSGATNIVHLLTKLTDLPQQVRILTTTRHDPRVLTLLSEAQSFDLIKDALQDIDDVQQYVLEQLAAKDGLEPEQRTLLATRLSQAAKGVFLYAYMVLGDLLPHLPELPDLETYPLPDGLSGLYEDFLNRELGQDDDRWYENFKPVLGLIAVAQGEGLTQTQLKRICRKDVEPPLRKCKQYLTGELPEGPFRVFHRSFADFLLDEPDNVNRHIDAATMHKQIANYYWDTYHEDWQQCDLYGLRNLISHQIACLSFLQNPADKQMQTKAIYNVVLDPAFRKAQHHKVGDGNISLNDLRHALDLALACDDIVPALKCVAAYRESIRGDQLVQPFFEAIDAQAFDLAQKHLSIYKGFLEWYAVAHLYLAWEASRVGDATTASELVQAARKLPVELTTELCRALRVQVAITLSQSATAVVPAMAYLEQWQTSEDRQYLEKLTNVAIPSPSALSHLRDELRSPEKAHWYEGDTAKKVIDILLQLVTTDEGRTDIDEFIRETRQWKYPHYRDVRLHILGIACAAAPDPIWMRKQLRSILVAVLDQGGATFTFALPAMLSAEAQVRNSAAPELAAYLENGLNTIDFFGTNQRAMLAKAGAEFRQGKHEQAFQKMQRILQLPHYPSAGLSVLTLLAMSDQYLEMGRVDLASGLIKAAENLVSHIYDHDLLNQRQALVTQYDKWITEQSLPEIEHISAVLSTFQDYDSRMAYIRYVAAQWAGMQEGPNIPALKALIVPSLNDGTTLDATLARFIGLNLSHLTDDDLNELVQLVGKSLPVD